MEVIPHGVPDLPFVDRHRQAPLRPGGSDVILSFGFWARVRDTNRPSRRCLPWSSRSDGAYVIVGATHPALLRREGEAYRTRLQTLVAELGMT